MARRFAELILFSYRLGVFDCHPYWPKKHPIGQAI
jgi:hypothetical protein